MKTPFIPDIKFWALQEDITAPLEVCCPANGPNFGETSSKVPTKMKKIFISREIIGSMNTVFPNSPLLLTYFPL